MESRGKVIPRRGPRLAEAPKVMAVSGWTKVGTVAREKAE
jgi:hypothetical protein